MATNDSVSNAAVDDSRNQSFWACVVLAVGLIAAGILVLGDLALAAVVSTVAIASAAILGGGFEIATAFWGRWWGAFAWQILLGTLYIAFGIALLSRPEFSAVVLIYVLGLLLLISGLVRIFLSFRYGRLAGWLLRLSGIVGVLAGAVILARWPITGVWIIGLALGVDLVSHGVGWLAVAWRLARATPTSTAAADPPVEAVHGAAAAGGLSEQQ